MHDLHIYVYIGTGTNNTVQLIKNTPGDVPSSSVTVDTHTHKNPTERRGHALAITFRR